MEKFRVNGLKGMSLGAAVGLEFFRRLFDYARKAEAEQKKLRVVAEYDPKNESAEISFEVSETNQKYH